MRGEGKGRGRALHRGSEQVTELWFDGEAETILTSPKICGCQAGIRQGVGHHYDEPTPGRDGRAEQLDVVRLEGHIIARNTSTALEFYFPGNDGQPGIGVDRSRVLKVVAAEGVAGTRHGSAVDDGRVRISAIVAEGGGVIDRERALVGKVLKSRRVGAGPITDRSGKSQAPGQREALAVQQKRIDHLNAVAQDDVCAAVVKDVRQHGLRRRERGCVQNQNMNADLDHVGHDLVGESAHAIVHLVGGQHSGVVGPDSAPGVNQAGEPIDRIPCQIFDSQVPVGRGEIEAQMGRIHHGI